VVIPTERVGEVMVAARARLDREETMSARLLAGELSYDIYSMRAEDGQVT
jgi:regulator of RNase E activity RraA